jgi:hypothetical protein
LKPFVFSAPNKLAVLYLMVTFQSPRRKCGEQVEPLLHSLKRRIYRPMYSASSLCICTLGLLGGVGCTEDATQAAKTRWNRPSKTRPNTRLKTPQKPRVSPAVPAHHQRAIHRKKHDVIQLEFELDRAGDQASVDPNLPGKTRARVGCQLHLLLSNPTTLRALVALGDTREARVLPGQPKPAIKRALFPARVGDAPLRLRFYTSTDKTPRNSVWFGRGRVLQGRPGAFLSPHSELELKDKRWAFACVLEIGNPPRAGVGVEGVVRASKRSPTPVPRIIGSFRLDPKNAAAQIKKRLAQIAAF